MGKRIVGVVAASLVYIVGSVISLFAKEHKMRRIYIALVALSVALMPYIAFADSALEHAISTRTGKYLGLVIVAIVAFIVRKISLRTGFKKAKAKREEYYNPGLEQVSTDVLPSQVRHQSKQHAISIVQQIIKNSYVQVMNENKSDLSTLVIDIDNDTRELEKQFISDVYTCAINTALLKEGKTEDYIQQGVEVAKKLGFNDKKIGTAFIILFVAYTGRKPKDEQFKIAKTIDSESTVFFKKHYYEAMKLGCKSVQNLTLKTLLSHYWHAKVLIDITYDENDINRLLSDNYIQAHEANDMLNYIDSLTGEFLLYEPMLRSYLSGDSDSGNLPCENDDYLNTLIDDTDIALLDEKRALLSKLP